MFLVNVGKGRLCFTTKGVTTCLNPGEGFEFAETDLEEVKPLESMFKDLEIRDKVDKAAEPKKEEPVVEPKKEEPVVEPKVETPEPTVEPEPKVEEVTNIPDEGKAVEEPKVEEQVVGGVTLPVEPESAAATPEPKKGNKKEGK